MAQHTGSLHSVRGRRQASPGLHPQARLTLPVTNSDDSRRLRSGWLDTVGPGPGSCPHRSGGRASAPPPRVPLGGPSGSEPRLREVGVQVGKKGWGWEAEHSAWVPSGGGSTLAVRMSAHQVSGLCGIGPCGAPWCGPGQPRGPGRRRRRHSQSPGGWGWGVGRDKHTARESCCHAGWSAAHTPCGLQGCKPLRIHGKRKTNRKMSTRGPWVAQLAHWPAPDSGSGHDLGVRRPSPWSSGPLLCGESARESLSLPPAPPPPNKSSEKENERKT